MTALIEVIKITSNNSKLFKKTCIWTAWVFTLREGI